MAEAGSSPSSSILFSPAGKLICAPLIAKVDGEKVPVLIPQTEPGIQNPFSRAWSSFLNGHDIHEEDFLHFIDHLNVCKAASPPFQVLSLAGNILGYT